jgi:polysaccharide pyruvyl transferase WcaK-like protein
MDTPKPLIFFNVHTQYENLGDMVINRNLLFLLRKHGEVIVNDNDTPQDFLDNLGVVSEERFTNKYSGRFFLKVLTVALKLRGKKDIYLFIPPGHRVSDLKVKQLILSLILIIFSILGIKVCEVGVSIGSFNWMKQLAEKLKSGFIHFYGVRDKLSRDIGNQYGIKNLSLVADLSLAYPLMLEHNKKYANQEHGDYLIKELEGLSNFSVLSFRIDTTDPKTKNYSESVTSYILETVAKLNQPLVLAYQVTQDKVYMAELYEKLKSKGHAVRFIDIQLDLAGAELLYSRAQYVLSNRLHVLLFAALVNSLPIAIINPADNRKISALFADAHLNELILDVEDKDFVKLEKSLANIADNKEAIKDKVATLIRRGAEVLSSVFNEIFRLPTK